MDNSFRLLMLPSLAQADVFKQLNPADLIDMSMLSTRFTGALSLNKIPFEYMHVILRDDFTGVTIGNRREKTLELECFYPRAPFANLDWKMRRFEGEDVMQISYRAACQRLFKATHNTVDSKMALLEKLITHLLRITKIEKFRLTCKREMDLSRIFFWRSVTNQLDFLEIVPTARGTIRVSSEDLRFLLDEISIDHIYLRVGCLDEEFRYRGPFTNRIIVIDDSSWVDFERLSICPKSVSVDFQIKHKIDESSINRLIREWIEGKSEMLQQLHFRWLPEIIVNPFPGQNDLTYDTWTHRVGRDYEELDFAKIMKDLNESETIFNNRQLQSRLEYLKFGTHNCDIKRETDGCVGTIIRDDENRKVSLIAWHKEHYHAGFWELKDTGNQGN